MRTLFRKRQKKECACSRCEDSNEGLHLRLLPPHRAGLARTPDIRLTLVYLAKLRIEVPVRRFVLLCALFGSPLVSIQAHAQEHPQPSTDAGQTQQVSPELADAEAFIAKSDWKTA